MTLLGERVANLLSQARHAFTASTAHSRCGICWRALPEHAQLNTLVIEPPVQPDGGITHQLVHRADHPAHASYIYHMHPVSLNRDPEPSVMPRIVSVIDNVIRNSRVILGDIVHSIFVCPNPNHQAHIGATLIRGLSSLTNPALLILFSFLSLLSFIFSSHVFPSFRTTCNRECLCSRIPTRPRALISSFLNVAAFVTHDSAIIYQNG